MGRGVDGPILGLGRMGGGEKGGEGVGGGHACALGFPFSQPTQEQRAEQGTSNSKHSQYFFTHREFLHLHPARSRQAAVAAGSNASHRPVFPDRPRKQAEERAARWSLVVVVGGGGAKSTPVAQWHHPRHHMA